MTGGEQVVTIDGPGAAGKSTTATALARVVFCRHLDSGSLYRAVAVGTFEIEGERSAPTPTAAAEAAAAKVTIEAHPDEPRFSVLLGGRRLEDELRTPEATRRSSEVAAIPRVRSRLLDVQRAALRFGPLVCDGRDMGSVVFPSAALKIYLVADAKERARRRRVQGPSAPAGEPSISHEDELTARDERDRTRADSPLVRPPGARVIDSTAMTFEEQVREVVELALAAGFELRDRRAAAVSRPPGRPPTS